MWRQGIGRALVQDIVATACQEDRASWAGIRGHGALARLLLDRDHAQSPGPRRSLLGVRWPRRIDGAST